MQISNTKLTPGIRALEWKNESCYILDQTKIPWSETYIQCHTYHQMIEAIHRLAVRGAPLIGIAGAYACVLAARNAQTQTTPDEFLLHAMSEIETARPTAVNLRWAVQRMRQTLTHPSQNRFETLLKEAQKIHQEDIESNQRIAGYGSALFQKGATVLTCCNTGDLATGGIGTAFGVLRAGKELDLISHVYVCETRPVLQGLRLTAWELKKNKIPYTVICDNMAASLMEKEKITQVIAGADRIAANGDTANKIGTYSLAVLARYHRIPFYIAAPFSTFDLTIASGKDIPIEQRNPNEVTQLLGDYSDLLPCYNPSFDVTPADLISAIICDRGAIHLPDARKIENMVMSSHRKPEAHSWHV